MKPEPAVPNLPDPEARITALLLGELSPAEEAEVRKALADYPTLAELHERLRKTIELVKEAEAKQTATPAAAATPAPKPEGAPEPKEMQMRFPEERRQILLAQLQLKLPPVPPLPRKRATNWFVLIGATAVIVVLAAGMLLPSLAKAKSKGMSVARYEQLGEGQIHPSSRQRSDVSAGQPVASERLSRRLVTNVTVDRNALGIRESRPETVKAGEPGLRFSVPSRGNVLIPSIPEVAKAEPAPQLLERYGLRAPATPPSPTTVAGAQREPSRERGRTGGATQADSSARTQIVLPPTESESAQTTAWADYDNDGNLDLFTSNRRGETAGRTLFRNNGDGTFEQITEGAINTAPQLGQLAGISGTGGAGGFGGGGIGGGGGGGAPVTTAGDQLSAGYAFFDTTAVAGKPVNGPAGGRSAGAFQIQSQSAATEDFGAFALTPPPTAPAASIAPTKGVVASSPATHGVELEPLEIKLPIPAFMGTPTDIPVSRPARPSSAAPATPPPPPPVATPSPLPVLGVELALKDDAGQPEADTDSAKLQTAKGDNRVPILGDRPMLGRLFRSEAAGQEAKLAESVAGEFRARGMQTRDAVVTEGAEMAKSVESLAPGQVAARFDNLSTVVADEKKVAAGAIVQELAERPPAEPSPQEESQLRRRTELQRQIANQEKVRDAVELRLLEETTDAAIPKAAAVEIIDLAGAQPTQKPSLWGRLAETVTGDVERSARLAVGKQTAGATPLGSVAGAPTTAATAFDPYFLQTESETIKSKQVLDKVIDKLDLDNTWAMKYGAVDTLSREQTRQLLSKRLEVQQTPDTGLVEVRAKSEKADEAALLANTVAEAYRDLRTEQRAQIGEQEVAMLRKRLAEQEETLAKAKAELKELDEARKVEQAIAVPQAATVVDRPIAPAPATPPPIPQPEIATAENAFSTFSLNVSDVSWKLAASSLENGTMPDPAGIRTEEFINAFDYRDPQPAADAPIGFTWERAQYPFAHNREIIRFSVKTAAQGREGGSPLNLVLLLDNSGSMERADRVQIMQEALRVLAGQLQPQDKISVVTFARTPRLWIDALPGSQAGELVERVGNLTPEGGTNLGDALDLAYQAAVRHYLAHGINRVVVLTDGAANLGDVSPDSLKQKVENHRRQGIALDCFGIGWEGYNDDLLEVLSRNGDGRYGFINTPEEAAEGFAAQLAGALQVAAADVKVQVEFNPHRTTIYRQIGYAKHQLTKEQFRDNTVDAAEIGAAESGNALYVLEVNPQGEGPIGVVRVRYRVPETGFYEEHEFAVPYEGPALALDQSSPAMRLAVSSSAFSEWLASNPYAAEVNPDRLITLLRGVPEHFDLDPRPKKLEWMIRQAKSIAGN